MIYINKDWCKGCELCIDSCPRGVLGKELMTAVVINEEKCVNCGVCEDICPDFAIHVRREKNE